MGKYSCITEKTAIAGGFLFAIPGKSPANVKINSFSDFCMLRASPSNLSFKNTFFIVVYLSFYKIFDNCTSCATPHDFDVVAVDPSTICQCTGLRDKNRKMIWENDIVDGHIKRGPAFYMCKVLWNECKARFDVKAMECNFPMTLDECVDDISVCGLDYEVIGNIFDNPELLEVGE